MWRCVRKISKIEPEEFCMLHQSVVLHVDPCNPSTSLNFAYYDSQLSATNCQSVDEKKSILHYPCPMTNFIISQQTLPNTDCKNCCL